MNYPSNGTETSDAAAAAVKPTKAQALRQRIYERIVMSGDSGMTDEELQLDLGIPGNTERPRRWELHKDGLIRCNASTRLTKSGRSAFVWVAGAPWRPNKQCNYTVSVIEAIYELERRLKIYSKNGPSVPSDTLKDKISSIRSTLLKIQTES